LDILPAIVLSAAMYFWCQILCPKCRFRTRPLVSPLNWFLCIFFTGMVLVPLAVALVGPSIVILPFKPSNTAINFAVLLNIVAYASFCCGVQVFHKDNPIALIDSSEMSALTWFPPAWLIVLYFILGVTGIALRFGSPGNLIDYFGNPQSYLLLLYTESGSPTTLASAAASFLMVFCPVSMILLWCRWTYRQHRKKSFLSKAFPPLLIVVAALSSALYSYSRAAFVIPMIAVAAVIAKRRTSLKSANLLGLGVLVACLVLLVSLYRSLYSMEGAVIEHSTNSSDISDMIQDYGTAPQFLGFFLQGTHYAEDPKLGRVLLASVLSPVPILGKSFREESGGTIYGNLLGRDDQPALGVAEFFLDFSVFGVIAGFLTVGALVATLQNCFDRANEPFEVYVLQFASVCFSYIVVSGIEEVSQHAIYLSWPIYCFLLYRWGTKKLAARRGNSENLGSLRPLKTG